MKKEKQIPVFFRLLHCLATVIVGIISIPAILRLKRSSVQVGDIVLYVNPQDSGNERNMITEVLSVFPEHKTALIRVNRTQSIVRVKDLQVLHVDHAFPLQIPEKPCAYFDEINTGKIALKAFHVGDTIPANYVNTSPGNYAGFQKIPLAWLHYGLMTQDGKLATTA
ncbi:MAG: hypothetical protein V4524_03845 [Patescibacteria group bacterium]